MLRYLRLIGAVFVCLAVAPSLLAKDKVKESATKLDVTEVNPEIAGAPRVLIIGDSVCRGYVPFVGEALKGKVNVYGTRKLAGDTTKGLEKIDEWLHDGTWDVIHFNWGLWDMLKTPEGKRANEPEQYEQNLRTLVAKLKESHARLIWATITPVPMEPNDVDPYNLIAAKVMAENGIAVDDLNTAVAPHVAEWRLPKDVHYNADGYKFLGGVVAESVETALAAKK